MDIKKSEIIGTNNFIRQVIYEKILEEDKAAEKQALFF